MVPAQYKTAFFLTATAFLASCVSTVKITVETKRDTNSGRPLYAVVRSVDNRTYLAEDYASVSEKVFKYPPDQSILRSDVVIPGEAKSFMLKEPEEGDLALYFFFTTPGDKWSLSLARPLPTRVEVELGVSEINKVSIER